VIKGRVNAELEAVIGVRVGWKQSDLSVDLILDTGFSEFLTLPPDLIASLELEYFESTPVQFADGRFDRVNVYHARLFWDGEWRIVYVQESEGDVLGGMRLLQGFSLGIDVVVGGDVSIEATD